MENKCCRIGEYECQVLLQTPIHILEKGDMGCLRKKTVIGVDACLLDEIRRLWSLGIVTTGNCCGHGERDGYIGVADEYIPVMLSMGYAPDAVEGNFIPKTELPEIVKLRIACKESRCYAKFVSALEFDGGTNTPEFMNELEKRTERILTLLKSTLGK